MTTQTADMQRGCPPGRVPAEPAPRRRGAPADAEARSLDLDLESSPPYFQFRAQIVSEDLVTQT